MKNFVKLLCLTIFFSGAYAQEIPKKDVSLISFDRIVVKEKNIAKSLATREYYRKAFIAAKVGIGTWSAFRWTTGLFNDVVSFFSAKKNAALNLSSSDLALLLNRSQETRMQSIMRGLGETALSACVYLSMYYMSAKVEAQYGPAPDIRWFVTIKNPFYGTLRELYFLAQEAALTKKPEELMEEMNQLFGKLIDQTENIVAFMRHKKEQFPENRKAKAEQIIQHFIGRTEVLYTDIARALHSDAYNVTFHLDSTLMLLEGECARFAAVEKSSWINPSAILGMMQNIA